MKLLRESEASTKARVDPARPDEKCEVLETCVFGKETPHILMPVSGGAPTMRTRRDLRELLTQIVEWAIMRQYFCCAAEQQKGIAAAIRLQ